MDKQLKRSAWTFIVLMGIVSMFSDITHEGAASIMGDFLALAGASAATIGFVSGLGECLGYSLRLVTGWIADRSRHYWAITIAGYAVDCFCIPALALVPRGGWLLACLLIIVRRMGKAVKKPAKDTLVSFAASANGVGKSFAMAEFLDQLGAFIGPLMLFLIMLVQRSGDRFTSYRLCFLLLGIPALITMALLIVARWQSRSLGTLMPKATASEPVKLSLKGNRRFLTYIIATSLFAAGFLDFTLITLHTARTGLIPAETLPLIYAGAMAVDGVAALFFGWLYDKCGLRSLVVSTALSAPFAIFIFCFDSRWALFLGVALWGIGMGAQESTLKAAVTQIVPQERRSTGFGIFQTMFGISWFLGSWLMGALYDQSPLALVVFSVALQLLSLPLFWRCGERATQH